MDDDDILQWPSNNSPLQSQDTGEFEDAYSDVYMPRSRINCECYEDPVKCMFCEEDEEYSVQAGTFKIEESKSLEGDVLRSDRASSKQKKRVAVPIKPDPAARVILVGKEEPAFVYEVSVKRQNAHCDQHGPKENKDRRKLVNTIPRQRQLRDSVGQLQSMVANTSGFGGVPGEEGGYSKAARDNLKRFQGLVPIEGFIGTQRYKVVIIGFYLKGGSVQGIIANRAATVTNGKIQFKMYSLSQFYRDLTHTLYRLDDFINEAQYREDQKRAYQKAVKYNEAVAMYNKFCADNPGFRADFLLARKAPMCNIEEVLRQKYPTLPSGCIPPPKPVPAERKPSTTCTSIGCTYVTMVKPNHHSNSCKSLRNAFVNPEALPIMSNPNCVDAIVDKFNTALERKTKHPMLCTQIPVAAFKSVKTTAFSSKAMPCKASCLCHSMIKAAHERFGDSGTASEIIGWACANIPTRVNDNLAKHFAPFLDFLSENPTMRFYPEGDWREEVSYNTVCHVLFFFCSMLNF